MTLHLLLQVAKLPIVAEMKQYFASLFAFGLASPQRCSPRKTSLWTCPRLPKTRTINVQLKPRFVILLASGWYFKSLVLKQMSIYKSNQHANSTIVTFLLETSTMVMSGVFGILLKVVLLFCAQLNQSILTAECLYIFVVCSCTSLTLCDIRSSSLSCLAMYRPL